MTTLQRSEALRKAREVIDAAEPGALTGAIDRAWASLRPEDRDALLSYRLAAHGLRARRFAGHHLFAEKVAEQLQQAQRPGVRFEPEGVAP